MAFHQPTRQVVQRIVRSTEALEASSVASRSQKVQHNASVDESQTWVLFSPATEATATSYLCETEKSLETPGRSRLSALGSLDTAPRTEEYDGSRHLAQASLIDVNDAEDDAELDSLDSHLPGFRSIPEYYVDARPDEQHTQAQPVFPSHDGLGSFRVDHPVHENDAQEQMFQFERFNPRRVHRRRDSLERGQTTLEQAELPQESEKRRRIEAWRLEHSQVILDEVRREARKWQTSHASLHDGPPTRPASLRTQSGKEELDESRWHDEGANAGMGDDEGFLARVTRQVRDILGIDDRMLAILIGDALPDEDDLSSTPTEFHPATSTLPQTPPDSADWQERIIERVSKELGLLVNHLSHHPGAFSTYARLQQMSIPYAGLPAIPESAPALPQPMETSQPEQTAMPEFQPTVPPKAAQPLLIPSRRPSTPQQEEGNLAGTFTKAEWEQDLDIKLVFRYLRSRFTSRSPSSPSGTAHLATTSNQDTAAKAARVRQHHPLVARSRPAAERRTFKATTPSSPVALRHGHASSCASQSTRRSARRSSVSSRHYWDIGTSLGTGSKIASNGPMGSWGEV